MDSKVSERSATRQSKKAGKESLLLTLPCFVQQKPKDNSKNKINQHLSRLYPQIVGPHKRK